VSSSERERRRYGLQPGERGYKPTDEGRRVSDEYKLHRLADPYGSIGKWFMVRLYDGSAVDHTLYDSKRDAAQHAGHNERIYMFVQVTPHTMSPEDADAMLTLYRKVYDKGNLRFTDPDHAKGGYEPIRRLTQRDQYNQVAAMFGKGPASNLTIGRK